MKPRSLQFRLAVAGVALASLARLSAEIPAIVEWHRTIAFPGLAALLQGMSGASPKALGEIVAALVIGFAGIALMVKRTRVLGAVTFVAGLLVFWFYASWGLSYQYPLLAARLAPPELRVAVAQTSKRLTTLTEQSARLAARAVAARPDFSGSESDLLARINSGLNDGISSLPESIEAARVRGVSFGPAKLSRLSVALSRLQLSGYYFPWTGEAQINAQMPRSLWPRVAAHEKAHQRGFAREDEATVMGVLTCLASSDPTVFYAGTLGLFAGFDREIARVDPEARRRIWAALPPRVVEAFRIETAFWKAHEGVAGGLSEKVNDTYLKSQGVRSGVGSYSETLRLLLQAVDTPSLGLGRLLDSAEPGSTEP